MRAWVVALAVAVAAGCGSGGETGAAPDETPATVVKHHPGPVRTIVRGGPVYHAGEAATIRAQRGIALRLVAKQPHVSRTRLSPTYGYPPARGYYVTFRMVITNTGSRPVEIGPSYFSVRIPGAGRLSATSGNAPYSGASSALRDTEVVPGETLRAPLTFDVPRPHGRLLFVPDRTPAATWTF